jgi:hypothetical protein
MNLVAMANLCPGIVLPWVIYVYMYMYIYIYIYIYNHDMHNRMVLFQRLTRNLLLTLHGHNVHRQQRQLSEFLMRYSQSFNVCTLGHTTHIHTAIKFIPDSVWHVRRNDLQHGRSSAVE